METNQKNEELKVSNNDLVEKNKHLETSLKMISKPSTDGEASKTKTIELEKEVQKQKEIISQLNADINKLKIEIEDRNKESDEKIKHLISEKEAAKDAAKAEL